MGEMVSFKHGTVENMYKFKDSFSNGTFIFCDDNEKFYLKMNGKICCLSPNKYEIIKKAQRRVRCCSCGALLPQQNPDSYESVVKCNYCGAIQDVEELVDVTLTDDVK